MACFALLFIVVIVLVAVASSGGQGKKMDLADEPEVQPSSNLPDEVRDSIDAVSQDLDRLIEYAMTGPGKGTAWQRAAHICDSFGHRQVGSQGLEEAIDEMGSIFEQDGLQNVRFETLEVPKWVRGEESAQLLAPLAGGKVLRLSMLGLGQSVGTPPEGIEAEVLVVKDMVELAEKAELARGRIVLFSFPFTGYGTLRPFRSHGPSFAAKLGGC
jgi:carboxypeptidase Q